jgi:hypothetical protein
VACQRDAARPWPLDGIVRSTGFLARSKPPRTGRENPSRIRSRTQSLSLYRRRERVSSVAAGHSPPAGCQRRRHGVEQSQPPELLPLLPFHLLPLGHLRRRHRRFPAERPTSREEQRPLGKHPLPPKGILSFRRWRRCVPAPPMFFFPVPPLDAHRNRAERRGLAAAHLCRRRR